jgi:hypothetical protein
VWPSGTWTSWLAPTVSRTPWRRSRPSTDTPPPPLLIPTVCRQFVVRFVFIPPPAVKATIKTRHNRSAVIPSSTARQSTLAFFINTFGRSVPCSFSLWSSRQDIRTSPTTNASPSVTHAAWTPNVLGTTSERDSVWDISFGNSPPAIRPSHRGLANRFPLQPYSSIRTGNSSDTPDAALEA